ncbi:MAG: PulJ/GspJ family protein [Candidatus Saccharimonadales bacterium]
MLKRIKDSTGDTIVEVLIALAVLSLAFVISYATADRAITDSQNAQEHTLALEYLDAQIEALRYYAGQSSQGLPTSSFFLAPNASNGTVQVDPGSGQEPGNGFSYSVSLTLDQSVQNTYHANVTWPGLGGLGQQSEELSYRVY